MNKKFTMMLAAFLAAGYTITAEAGVVKIANPKTSQSYVITDVTKEGVGFTKSLDGSPSTLSAVSASNLGELEGDAQWTITAGTGEKIKLEKKGGSSNGVQYSTGSFTYGSPLSDLIFTGSAILGDKGKYLDVANPGTAASELKEVAFYAVGVNLDCSSKVVKIGDKYLIAKTEGTKVVPQLVTLDVYSSMETPTVWSTESGKLKTNNLYLCRKADGGIELLTENTTAIVFQTIETNVLTVTKAEGENVYVDADLKETTEASKAVTVDVTSQSSDLKVTKPSGTVVDKALSGLSSSNSRLVVYTGSNLSTPLFVSLSDKKEITVSEFTSKDESFYWSMSDGKIKNAEDGDYFVIEGQQSFTAVKFDGLNAFYLVAANGQFVTYDDGFSLGGDNTNVAIFSAVEGFNSPLDAIALNEDTQGVFSVTYKYGETTAEDNLFDNITAIKVINTGAADDKYVIGTYFVTSAPSALKLEEAYDLNDDDDKKALNAMTFVAAHPSKKYFTEKNDGTGVKFTTVKGSDIVKVADAAKDKITANNAAFQMSESDINEGKLIFKLPTANLYNASTDKMYTSGELTVTAAEYGDKAVVTTSTSVTDYMFATLGSENIVEYEDFLTADRQVYNIQFLSTVLATEETDEDELTTKSECNKYLGLGGKDHELLAQGSDFVDLNAPQNQWVVSNMTKENVITFMNREGGQTFAAKLVKTDKEDVYRLANVTATADMLSYMYVDKTTKEPKYADDFEIKANMLIKLVPVTVDMMAGYVSDELDEQGLVKMSFSIENAISDVKLYLTEGEEDALVLNKDKASQFEVVKFESDTIFHANKYAYLNDKKEIKQKEEDKLAVITYAFKQYRTDGKEYYLDSDLKGVTALTGDQTAEEDAQRFLVKINKDGSYSLIAIEATDEKFVDIVSKDANTFDVTTTTTTATVGASNIYAAHTAKFQIEGEAWTASYNHAPQHVMFQNGNSYMAVSEAGAAIMEAPSALKAEYTKADLTFWLDTTDNKANVPTFYISKGAKEYMFNATDSLKTYNEGTASAEDVKEYLMPGFTVGDKTVEARAIFRAATLKDSKTLVTSIDGKETELTKAEDLANYQFKIVLKDEATSDEYVVRSLNGYQFLYELNGQLGFTDNKEKATAFTIERVEAPTSNESVSASEVKVIANNGSVVVKNAAGKNVVVSTILGQVVANEVLTSDNATINVPAGIVVVAVEGESFKINVR